MNMKTLINAMLTGLALFVFSPVRSQQGISEDMLNMMRKQGINIDGPVPPMDATKYINSVVNVDCATSKGELLHTEKYNNFSHSEAFVQSRSTDVAFYNKIGLHGKIYRVWLENDRFYDPATGKVDFHEMPPYLADASAVSDYLLVNCGHLGMKNDWKLSEQKSVERLAIILSELKKQFPKVRYIEATNEPDYSNEGYTPANYYDTYKIFYKAVNKVNAGLKPAIPLLVGGPSTAQLTLPWMRGFLDSYVKDPSSDKHIDFISYHGYFTKPDSAYIMFRDNPMLVKDQRNELSKELTSRGLNADIPVFITEMGLYPGPSFDDYPTMKYDRLRQAAGMPSIFYWYMESKNTYPFNWVFRHQTEGRKDQLVSRDEKGQPFVHTEKLTPYGNAMLMMSKLKTERLAASTSIPVTNGKGLYALAAKDNSGVSVMVWNYQSKQTEGYRFEVNVNNLPNSLKNKNVKVNAYRIDQKTSNYQNGLENANLQLVEETSKAVKSSYSASLTLEPNALYLLVLEPK
jgi:hypothetical protein